MNTTKKFELGEIVVTNGIADRMADDKKFIIFIQNILEKYMNCDWGDTCEEDSMSNDDAVTNNERILAVYIFKKTKEKIWIITEWDRSVTTILFPSEY